MAIDRNVIVLDLKLIVTHFTAALFGHMYLSRCVSNEILVNPSCLYHFLTKPFVFEPGLRLGFAWILQLFLKSSSPFITQVLVLTQSLKVLVNSGLDYGLDYNSSPKLYSLNTLKLEIKP